MSDLVAAFHEAMPRLLALHSQASAFHTRETERVEELARRWDSLQSEAAQNPASLDSD